jgi:hypothetical protein
MSSSDWPKAEAERAKLYIPSTHEPYQESEPGKCFLRFDADNKLLLLVSEANGETVDVIDPNDIIGAAVEVELLGLSETPRSVKNKSFFRNPISPEDTSQDKAASSSCGIFKPLVEDVEKLFSVSNNEPFSEIPFDTQAAAVLTLYVYPRVDYSKQSFFRSCGLASKSELDINKTTPTDLSKLGPRQAHHRKFQVAPAEDFSAISTVVQGIRKLCRPNLKGDRLLVVVNPFSGTAKGNEVYETVVAPMLDQAGLDYDHLITTHAHHAEERMKEQPKDSETLDLSEYDGIVAIGGDGIIHEIMQGIYGRSDCQELLKKFKLGHVGAGTSNGLAMSLAHASKVGFATKITLITLVDGTCTPSNLHVLPFNYFSN